MVAEGRPPVPRDARPDDVRGGSLLRAIERAFLWVDRALDRALPREWNPFLQTGSLANTFLVVATVTGVPLLLWYSPSVHLAYGSVQAMDAQPLLAGLLRSLHRYSSDAAMFFVLVHALRTLAERRFPGPRWLGWVTGGLSLAVTWAIGWLGFWLVWDMPAQHVALGTARFADGLPIFVDPLSRAFLTNEGVNSLLFFVVFFFHMLVPLVLAILLWLHIARLSRPQTFSTRPMTIWALVGLTGLSLVWPIAAGPAADVTATSQRFPIDAWYLAPVWLTDRLGSGALWAAALVGGALVLSVPWTLTRKRRVVAEVVVSRCNECRTCFEDCPYDAIRMVPRTDGHHRYATQAWVDPDKCVACGICAGSCDSAGIGLPWFDSLDTRHELDRWLADRKGPVLMGCAESAAGGLTVDAGGRCAELPDWHVQIAPCAGVFHTLQVERAFRRGATAVAVATCPPGACVWREGEAWTADRMAGVRKPALRHDKVPAERTKLVQRDRTAVRALIADLAALDGRQAAPVPRSVGGVAAFAVGVLIAAVLAAGSGLGYAAPAPDGGQIVVSFKHPGEVSEQCRDLTPEEKAARPIHMQQERVCERARADVRLRVRVDGELVLERTYRPSGLWGDGPSVAIETIEVPEGRHRVDVALGDTHDGLYGHTDAREVDLARAKRQVVLFDRGAGFTWH